MNIKFKGKTKPLRTMRNIDIFELVETTLRENSVKVFSEYRFIDYYRTTINEPIKLCRLKIGFSLKEEEPLRTDKLSDVLNKVVNALTEQHNAPTYAAMNNVNGPLSDIVVTFNIGEYPVPPIEFFEVDGPVKSFEYRSVAAVSKKEVLAAAKQQGIISDSDTVKYVSKGKQIIIS